MSPELVEPILTGFEISLFLTGLGVIGFLAFNPAFRTRWWFSNRLPTWNVAVAEFAMYLFVFFTGSFVLQSGLALLLGKWIAQATDRAGLELIVYTGAGLDGGAILGWLLFPLLRRAWHADYGVTVPVESIAPTRLPWIKVLLYGGALLAVALPVLTAVSLGWSYALKIAGLPDQLQESIAIFTNTKSRFVIAGMLVAACILAPTMEELLFRAGIYRFCRKHLGRAPSLIISGLLFGAIHQNWVSFLPLAVLGMMLALVYEATGSIRVAIVAHAFFNMNSLLAILSGVTP